MSFERKPFLSPAPGGLSSKVPSSLKAFHERMATNASRENQEQGSRVQEFLSDYVDTPMTINGETLIVLARRVRVPGEADVAAATGALQVRLRLVDKKYTVGITQGVFQGVFGSVVPTIEPEGDPIEVSPVYWWKDKLSPTAENAKKVWAKCLINDKQPYYGIITAVELHLLDSSNDPDPNFLREKYQWLHLATVSAENDLMSVTSHISGSPGVTRQGGPGSAYVFYPV
jgi:hypothetical protein